MAFSTSAGSSWGYTQTTYEIDESGIRERLESYVKKVVDEEVKKRVDEEIKKFEEEIEKYRHSVGRRESIERS